MPHEGGVSAETADVLRGQVTTATPHASAMLMEAGQGKPVITATR